LIFKQRKFFMSIFKNNIVTGITAALVTIVIAPVLVPAIKKASRPLAKSLVKGGIFVYEKGREAVANAGEMMEDVVAEVRAETMERQSAATAEGLDEGFQMPAHGDKGSSAMNAASSVEAERGGAT
jgi:hypothetical protein